MIKDLEERKENLIRLFEVLHKKVLRLMRRSPLSIPELRAMLISIEEMLKIMHEVTILNIRAEIPYELKP